MPLRLLVALVLVAGCDADGRVPDDLGAAPPDLAAPAGPTQCLARPAHLVSSLPGAHRTPRVAWSGAGFVVAWNTTLPSGAHRIDVAVTDAVGQRLGPNVPLSAAPIAAADAPSLAPVVGGFVVAWTALDAAGRDVVLSTLDNSGQRLDAAGAPCDPADATCSIVPVTASGAASQPALGRPRFDGHTGAPSDTDVGLAFVDGRNHGCPAACDGYDDVYWEKLSSRGGRLVAAQALTPPGASVRSAVPAMAFDGTRDGVVWRDDTLVGISRWAFVTVDGSGALASGPSPTRVGVADGVATQIGGPALVWDGTSYALAIGAGDAAQASVVFQRFDPDGKSVLTPVRSTYGRSACAPTIAWNGTNEALAWQSPCDDAHAAVAFELLGDDGVRVDKSGQSCGTSTDPTCGVVVVAQDAASWAGAPDLAWAGGSSFGVAWQTHPVGDGGEADDQIWLARVDCVSP